MILIFLGIKSQIFRIDVFGEAFGYNARFVF